VKKLIATCVIGSIMCVAAEKKNAIQRFGDADLPVIRTKMRFTTLVVLPDGEEIAEVICGDKDYWVIEGRDSMVYVKPSTEGAFTNINVISKSKTVYSFLVQEISKAGSKEKPDLKVILAAEETTKLKKDRENLEEALHQSERTVKELLEKASREEQAKKKAEVAVEKPKPEMPKVIEPAAGKNTVTENKPAAVAASVKPSTITSPAASTGASGVEKPIAVTYAVIKPRDGILRIGGRLFRGFFSKVTKALRLY
jgi:hypothetical protein